jgi:hypothetical protein
MRRRRDSSRGAAASTVTSKSAEVIIARRCGRRRCGRRRWGRRHCGSWDVATRVIGLTRVSGERPKLGVSAACATKSSQLQAGDQDGCRSSQAYRHFHEGDRSRAARAQRLERGSGPGVKRRRRDYSSGSTANSLPIQPLPATTKFSSASMTRSARARSRRSTRSARARFTRSARSVSPRQVHHGPPGPCRPAPSPGRGWPGRP